MMLVLLVPFMHLFELDCSIVEPAVTLRTVRFYSQIGGALSELGCALSEQSGSTPVNIGGALYELDCSEKEPLVPL